MKIKYRIVTVLLVLLLSTSVYATSAESLLSQAKNSSPEVKTYERTKENSLLLKSQSDIDGTTVSVSSGAVISEDSSYIANSSTQTSSVSITLPEIGDNFFISTGASISAINLKEESSVTLKPNLSLSKTFSLKSFKDSRSDIEDLITAIKVEYNYNSSMTSFENTFYQNVINILKAQLSIKKAQRSYDSSKDLYEKQLTAGFLTEGSLPALKTEMSLESARASLEASRTNLESLLVDFRDKYGMEYEDVTSARDSELEITENSELSSTVRIASLSLESAKQDLDEQTGHSGTLKTTASAVPSIIFDKDLKYDSSSMTASVDATYSDKNWSVSAVLSDTTDFEKELSPVLTVSGKWSNSTSSSETDRINEQRLTNTYLEKQNDFDSALSSYASSILSLKASVNEHSLSEKQNEISCDYNRRTYEMTEDLYKNSLVSEQELEDALFEVECDQINTLILKLQGLILENRIKLLNM
ncbi:MAG: hypothetical protein K6F82_03560 [Sphaerochaetaceae bacterium]|nr:hypothetical protein [Sphaerochaetaceae bacterium]